MYRRDTFLAQNALDDLGWATAAHITLGIRMIKAEGRSIAYTSDEINKGAADARYQEIPRTSLGRCEW
jgi:hypothetical protein